MAVSKIAYDPVGYVSYKDYMFMASKIGNKLQNMIRYERFEQAAMADNADMAARIIAEAGWPNMVGMSIEEIDRTLVERRNMIYDEIESVCPEYEVIAILRLKFDYHNIKALVKSGGAHTNADTMLSSTGRYSRHEIREAYLSGDYSALTNTMAETIREAKDLMAKTQNPHAVDTYVDRMYFKEMFELAEKIEPDIEPVTPMMAAVADMPFPEFLVRTYIDCANLHICVRCARMNRSAEYLRGELFEGGTLGIKSLVDATFTGEGLATLYRHTPYKEAAELGQEVMKTSLGTPADKFERSLRESRMRYLANMRQQFFGARTVVWYLTVIDENITNTRVVLTGLKSGIKGEKLKERLRKTYV